MSQYTISEHRSDTAETPCAGSVIVTGGTGKISLQTCHCLAASGANVVVSDIRAEPAAQLVDEPAPSSTQRFGFNCPQPNAQQSPLKQWKKYSLMDTITQPIVAPFQFKSFEEMPDEEFRNTFESDMMGLISVMGAA